jgi:ubiquinone/menaquinone biosynthesis C-methylase UbiE
MSHGPEYWHDYILHDFDFAPFPPGSHILDVGCGSGAQLRLAESRGCTGVGVEPRRVKQEERLSPSPTLIRGVAEELPFPDASFDGVICKVVTPYTDEKKCVAEIARVVRPHGTVVFCHHGPGYFLRYVLRPPSWKYPLYGIRAIANTLVYRLTARRLPGIFGGTMFQTSRQLRRYYESLGLFVRVEQPSPRFLHAPVFIYEVLARHDVTHASLTSTRPLARNEEHGAMAAPDAMGGIGADRLSAAGFGQERPIASNDSEEGRAKNRCTELVITAK